MDIKDIHGNTIPLNAKDIVVPSLGMSLDDAIEQKKIPVPDEVTSSLEEMAKTIAVSVGTISSVEVEIDTDATDVPHAEGYYDDGVLSIVLYNIKGDKGETGDVGESGKSAYDLAVEEGYEGTEEEWLASLKGADGSPGADGKDGIDGKDGKDGSITNLAQSVSDTDTTNAPTGKAVADYVKANGGTKLVQGSNVTLETLSDGSVKISASLTPGTATDATQVAYTNGQTTTAGGTVADKLTELDNRVNDVCGSNDTPSTSEQSIDDYTNIGLLWNTQGIIKSDQRSYKTSDYVAIDLTRLQSLTIVAMMGNTYGGGICFYDSNKNYISNIYHTSSNWQDNESYQVSIADIPSKTAYFRTCGIVGTTKTKAKYTLVQHSTDYGEIGNLKALQTHDKSSLANAINEIVSANRLSINIYTTDTEVEILNKMIKAREAKNVDVYWQHGIYTFSSVYGYMQNTLGWGWTMGLPIGGNCRYYFNGSSLISNPLEGYNQERNILDTKACAENFELYDGILINNGGVYCVHDEGYDKIPFYVHRYRNMRMEYKSGDATISISKCIGGGTGLNGNIDIEGCTFKTDNNACCPTSWHGNIENDDVINFTINIRNCYFDYKSISLDSELREGDIGELIFVGNTCKVAPSTKNWTTKIGNNEIRQ